MSESNRSTIDDPIIDEIHRYRREHAERFNYDLEAIFADVKSREGTGGHKVVRLQPKRIEPPKSKKPEPDAN